MSPAERKELEELRAFKKTVEPVLQHIYDVLYFDSDKNYFDPQKEIDSACDFLDMIHEEMLTLYPSPKARSRRYPPMRKS